MMKFHLKKEYIESIINDQKVKFFNDNFLKFLKQITNHNINSYNINRSTIYDFPSSGPVNNSLFYINAIEECRKAERFDVSDDVYHKIISLNQTNDMTVIKNMNKNKKINIRDLDLDIYYPLLHVEQIKFRQSNQEQNIFAAINENFEPGNIPPNI